MRQIRYLSIAVTAALLPLVAIRLLSTTVGLSTPASYFEAFKAIDALLLGLMLWDTFVIFGGAYGIPALTALLVLRNIGMVRSIQDVVLFSVVGILGMRLAPLYLGGPFVWPGAWWHLGPELTFMLVGVLGLVSLRVWPNNSFKGMPLRGTP